MMQHDKYCPEKGSRGVNRPKICQNVSKIPLFLVSKTGLPKRIFLIINRYDYYNVYIKALQNELAISVQLINKAKAKLTAFYNEQGVPLISARG